MAVSSLALSGCAQQVPMTGIKLPKECPFRGYPNAECTMADQVPVAQGVYRYTIVMQSMDDHNKILEYYKSDLAMNGLMLKSQSEEKGKTDLNFKSDKAEAYLSVTPLTSGMQIITLIYKPIGL